MSCKALLTGMGLDSKNSLQGGRVEREISPRVINKYIQNIVAYCIHLYVYIYGRYTHTMR